MCLVEGQGALISSSCHQHFISSSVSHSFPVTLAGPLASSSQLSQKNVISPRLVVILFSFTAVLPASYPCLVCGRHSANICYVDEVFARLTLFLVLSVAYSCAAVPNPGHTLHTTEEEEGGQVTCKSPVTCQPVVHWPLPTPEGPKRCPGLLSVPSGAMLL